MKQEYILTIERPGGKIEKLNVEKRFGKMNQEIFDKIKKETFAAGRGNVLQCEIIEDKSNIGGLERDYNNLYNEGGEGFIPDLTKSPEYRTWTDTTIIK